MNPDAPSTGNLSHPPLDLDAFVRDGYLALRGAVDPGTVAACQELTWAAMERRGIDRDNPGSWPPLAKDMDDIGEALVEAYLSPSLTAAYDELIGPGRWNRSVSASDLGRSVVVRFPAEDRANAGYLNRPGFDGGSGYWIPTADRSAC